MDPLPINPYVDPGASYWLCRLPPRPLFTPSGQAELPPQWVPPARKPQRSDTPFPISKKPLNPSLYVIAGENAGTKNERPRSDLKRPWQAVARRANFTGVRIHDLRHTHASVGAGAGLGLPIIGKLLGHAHATTTARYAHLDADPLRRASERIGLQLSKAIGEKSGASAQIRKFGHAPK
jgi:hypothetical protein